MKKTLNPFASLWTITIFFFALLNTAAFAQTSTAPPGSGTSADPYQISTLNHLYWFSSSSGTWNKYFILMADIDASSTITWDGGAGWMPVGNSTTKFTGSFDGQRHLITGLYISRSGDTYVGLFGLVSGATIRNLGLRSVTVAGGTYTGALAGQTENSTVISSCFSTGVVSGYATGGLVGAHTGSNIADLPSYINDSYSIVSVTGTIAGGLAGHNQRSFIDNCYSRGSVNGESNSGGLVGINDLAEINHCYSTGAVTGSSNVGGLVGHAGSSGDIYNSFWDTQTSGTTRCEYAVGKTTTEMRTLATFISAGWDFTGETANGTDDHWNMNASLTVNSGYPYLQWQDYSQQLLPSVSTLPASGISAASAAGNGRLMDFGIPDPSQHGFCWNTTGDPDVSNNKTENGAPLTTGTFTSAITGLTSNTTYYMRAYVTNSAGTSYGNQVSFTTSTAPPSVTTQAVSSIAITSAAGNGSITDLGSFNPIQHGVCWNTSGNPTISDNKTENGAATSTGAFITPMTGLQPNTTYYVKAYATNSIGTSYGDQVSFTTKLFNGSGTSDDPYQISSLEDLSSLFNNSSFWNKHFKQTADIDAASCSTWNSSTGWLPIGNSTTKFTGSYNGQGYTISGLYISRPGVYNLGLFGYTSGAAIQNLGLINSNVSGSDSDIGALAGRADNATQISNCYSTGNVSGNNAGGLIGVASNSSSLNYCFSSANVTGTSSGGLISQSLSSGIYNSYSTGNVSGSSCVGGLVSILDHAAVNRCYSIGFLTGSANFGGLAGYNSASTVSNSFWNTQTSGKSTSAGGTGRTTAELKAYSTFINAGWDFADETANGTNNYWGINQTGTQNSGYPFLQWQGYSHLVLPEVTTQSVSGLTAVSAEANGNITYLGNTATTQHGFCWNSSGSPTTTDNKSANGSAASPGAFTSSVTGLLPYTAYYIRAYAVNTAGTAYGGEVSFTTSAVAPTVTTQAVSDISGTTATGNGNITALGIPNPTQYGICWNTSGTPTTADSKTTQGTASSTGSFTASITGLSANTTYFARAYAVNAAGTSYGDVVSFTTSAIAPAVSTQDVTEITTTSATGNGNITALGSFNPSQHGVCWNTSGSPTISDSKTTNGTVSSTGAFTAAITGLSAGTVYYVRAYATNTVGTSYGNQVTFTTPFFNGSGTLADKYQISTSDELRRLSENSSLWNKHFKQTADIDASACSTWNSNTGFSPIGNSTVRFTGSYDGQNHTITGLFISRSGSDNQGLFGYTGGAVIQNLGLVNAAVTGNNFVGILAGNSETPTDISNCYSAGSVNCARGGGLVGANGSASGASTISNCYSTADVTASSIAGGLVGDNSYSAITNCYSTGTVNGGTYIGGLVGINYNSTITRSYSIGQVGTAMSSGGLVGYNSGSSVSGSFWNTQTSGKNSSAGGTGKTTAEMKSYLTFINAGWDFIGETANGTSSCWGINQPGTQNGGYPFLAWQGYSHLLLPSASTQNVSAISSTSATGNGNVTFVGYPEPSQHGVCWSTTGTPAITDSKTSDGAVAAAGSFTSSITGLSPNTTYYVRAYVTNDAGTAYGSLVSFTTQAVSADVTTGNVTDITSVTATGNGNITSLGSPNPTQHGVCWNTTGSPSISDNKTSNGIAAAAGEFSAAITGLSPNTLYYVRAYATNIAGTAYGNEVSFTTLGPSPVVTTLAVSNISGTTATGNGNITYLGIPDPTQHGVCWNTSGTPTTADNKTEDGPVSAAGIFTSSITGLTPGTTYFVRAYAVNTVGTSYGSQTSFIAGFFTGAGTLSDPYQIATLEDLKKVSEDYTFWDKHFKQTADIDASACSTWNFGEGLRTIGTEAIPFSGSYNGQGHIINSLFISRTTASYQWHNNQGMFGYVSGGVIQNLGLTNATISGASNAGALAGYITSSAQIRNCFSTGSVTASSSCAGGLAGNVGILSTIENSYSRCSVSAPDYAGGLIGYNQSSAVTRCYSTGAVSGSGTSGGLVAYNSSGTFSNSFWDTQTSGMNTSGGYSENGGTGKTTAEMKSFETFFNAGWDFSGENTNGSDNTWGINQGSTQNGGYPFLSWQGYTHSSAPGVLTRQVTGITHTSATGSGTLAYTGSSAVSQHGFCWNTSGNPTTADNKTGAGSASGTGDFTSALTGLSGGTTYFVRAYAVNSSGTSYGNQVSFNTGFSSGSGSAADPYLISSLGDLKILSENSAFWNRNFRQTADIDASPCSSWNAGTGWSPIGNYLIKFKGTYDGGGHSISGLFIEQMMMAMDPATFNQGFFGYTDSAVIKNLGVINVSITAPENAGALAGSTSNLTQISRCYSSGTVTASYAIGGLVGKHSSSAITNSYSSCSISGNYYGGGLIGYLTDSASADNSYSTGTVFCFNYAGGFAGSNNSSSAISRCYSNGSVTGSISPGGFLGYNSSSTADASYWDTETSGQSSSAAGTGRTTAEMKSFTAFYNAGWDFAGINSGTTWNIGNSRNNGYPYLQWQYPGDSALPVELVSFIASADNYKVILAWKTATEVNCSGFEIERKNAVNNILNKESSIESFEWRTIGFVAGSGNSNSPKEYSFTDKSAVYGEYTYRLKQIDNDGTFTYSKEVKVTAGSKPAAYKLENFPDPFNPETTIRIELPVTSKINVSVYDALGRRAAALFEGEMEAGVYQTRFSGKNLSSGIYILTLTSDKSVAVVKKIMLIK